MGGVSTPGRSSAASETEQMRQTVDPEGGPRRNGGKRESNFHSLHSSNKSMLPYLKDVPEGIKAAAKKHGMTLDPADVEKLEKFGGDYSIYIPWGSKWGRDCAKLKCNVGKSKEDIK